MCLPALPLIGAIVGVAGTAMQVIGGINAANSTQASMNYQAQVNRNNAVIAENNAKAVQDAGQTEEQAQRQKTAQLVGRARATMAANGIDTTSGTSLDILGDTAKLGELDALTIRSNTARKAYGYRVQGMSDMAQADLDVASGKNAVAAGQTNAFGSVLSGATSLSDKFMGWQKQGLLS